MGTAYGTNTIAGDTQIGNSERRIEFDQKGMAIIDAVTEKIEFAVEQYEASKWRVDLKGNNLTNAGAVSAEALVLDGVDVEAWPETVLEPDKAQWALDAYSPPTDFTVETNATGITIRDYVGPGGTVRDSAFYQWFAGDGSLLGSLRAGTRRAAYRGATQCDGSTGAGHLRV
jgi:hypothetical protein